MPRQSRGQRRSEDHHHDPQHMVRDDESYVRPPRVPVPPSPPDRRVRRPAAPPSAGRAIEGGSPRRRARTAPAGWRRNRAPRLRRGGPRHR